MKLNRDTIILLVTLLPIGLVLWAFIVWRQTGVWPASIPTIPIPVVNQHGWTSGPSVPPDVQALVNRARANAVVMVGGLLAGLILGIMVMGSIADGLRFIARRITRRNAARAQAEAEAAAEELVEQKATAGV